MPLKVLCTSNHAAVQFPAQSVLEFGSARQFRLLRFVTYTLELLLVAPGTTHALELGEASIQSGLGQSLLVEIPYRLAANERLTPGCVSLVPAMNAADALPTYANVTRITIGSTHIEIFDSGRVLEPLIGLNVAVECNTAPHFVRSYQLFVDPPARIPAVVANRIEADAATVTNESVLNEAAPIAATTQTTTAAVSTQTATTPATAVPTASAPIASEARTNVSPRARGRAGGSVTQGQTYRVVRGDTLSGIAARITERPATILETVDAIFAANPAAFIHGNRDLIEEGRSITIPILRPTTSVTAVPTPAVRQAESLAGAPAPPVEPVPTGQSAPPIAAQPPRAEDTAIGAPVTGELLPVDATPVAAPPAGPIVASAPAAASTRAEPTVRVAAQTTGGRSSLWAIGLLALGLITVLLSLAFIRRQRKLPAAPQAAPQAGGNVEKSRARPPAVLVSDVHVVEHRAPERTLNDNLAPVRGAESDAEAADSSTAPPTNSNDLGLPAGPTGSVDLDVGTPLLAEESVDETVEEDAATVRLTEVGTAVTALQQPLKSSVHLSKEPIDDGQITMTIGQLDMLRQDHEAEHTLTQLSKELRDAVADLEATKAARAAAGDAAKSKLPPQSQAEDGEAPADAATVRIRVK